VHESRKTVMIIEDDFELRAMLSEMLYANGYMVYSVDDATNAYDMARTLRPAVVLCDVLLPTTTGFEAAERLHRGSETSRIPVILMSGHGYLRENRPAEERWLMKPFTGAELATALQEAAA
jgi:two-component system, sensor histidine kinase and response regulator